jgi:hypothetical protein
MGGKGRFRGGTREQSNDMANLDGTWRVERTSGLLPPVGLTKKIVGGRGWTLAAGVPVAPFRVAETTLVYRGWPVRDELEADADGSWRGRGVFLGREFCRFRLVRATARPASSV